MNSLCDLFLALNFMLMCIPDLLQFYKAINVFTFEKKKLSYVLQKIELIIV